MSPAPALALLVVLAAGPAFAGAWPREPGGTFLSFRIESRGDASLYGEYGLTERLTLGGQLATDERHEPPHRDLPPPRDGRISAFARYALGRLDATNRFAISLGVSAPPDTAAVVTDRPRLETGLHWGRGFSSRWGDGWATATLRLLFDRDETISDLSGLVGLRPRERWMAMLSLGRYRDDGGTYLKLTPSLGYEVRPRLWLVPSLTRDFGDARDTRAALAIWWSF